jgi:hypothetical protein
MFKIIRRNLKLFQIQKLLIHKSKLMEIKYNTYKLFNFLKIFKRKEWDKIQEIIVRICKFYQDSK